MRVFSTAVSSHSSYLISVPPNMDEVLNGLSSIAEVLEVDLPGVTPAEERALINFVRWSIQLGKAERLTTPADPDKLGTFVVSNLNTGKSIVFVAIGIYGDTHTYGCIESKVYNSAAAREKSRAFIKANVDIISAVSVL